MSKSNQYQEPISGQNVSYSNPNFDQVTASNDPRSAMYGTSQQVALQQQAPQFLAASGQPSV